ncbi:hypothetical protein [Cryobacterium sp. TMT4-31]|uniref:hypothetical protein n=1 Tax=Cryobacterium sp. TMT4-31 TaxID=1259259 RepID=UPI00106C3109|nr:hypothetical protein [Cryobacterium sp. TMT4-31]TFC86831.1 hypothetical protein E3T19_13890 [Cryobacterium sp. TMT4-31]
MRRRGTIDLRALLLGIGTIALVAVAVLLVSARSFAPRCLAPDARSFAAGSALRPVTHQYPRPNGLAADRASAHRPMSTRRRPVTVCAT